MNNLITRSITGIFFVLIILGSVIASTWLFALLFLFVSILTQLEFYKLMRKDAMSAQTYTGLGAGIILYATLAISALGISGPAGVNILILNLIPLILVFIVALFSGSSHPFGDIGFTLTGILYIALPFGLLNYFYLPSLKGFDYGVLLGFFLILWLNDTAAYLVGSVIGKHRLFERISPKKSWEGSVGGALFALSTAWLLSFYFHAVVLWQWLVIAMIIVVFGTLGDLVESMLKRSLGIKDSGNILPGHGGMLDRFDAVLLSAPVVFVLIAIFTK